MKKTKFLLIILTLCFSLGITAFTVGCNEEKIAYTVTVTCEDSAVLDDIIVKLSKWQQPLENGTVVLYLKPDVYKVELVGVPDNYTYNPKTVTAKQPDTTIELTKKLSGDETISYTITLLFPDGSPVANCGVTLVLASQPDQSAITLTTDEKGKASTVAKADIYEVHIADLPVGYTLGDKKYTVNASDHDLTITLEEISEPAPPATLSDFQGNWNSVDKKIALTVDNNGMIIFNSQPCEGTFQDNSTLSFDMEGTLFALTKHTFAEKVLTLRYSGKSTIMLPANNYPTVNLPNTFGGTWKSENNSGISFYLKNSIFQLTKDNRQLMGSVIGMSDESDTTKILAITADESDPENPEYGIYELYYDKATKQITVKNIVGNFVRTGMGSESDPYIIDYLVGDYSFNLEIRNITSNESFGAATQIYNPIYLSYIPTENESYVVWNPFATGLDRTLSLLIGVPAGTDSEGATSYNAVLKWDAYIPVPYQQIELEKNTEYIFIVSAYPDYTSLADRAGLPQCTVYFSIANAEGFTQPEPFDIPSKLAKTWYSEENPSDVIIIDSTRVLWNNRMSRIEQLNADGSVTAEFNGQKYTFLAESEISLTVTQGSESQAYSAIPPELISVSYMFGRIWQNAEGKLLYFYLEPNGVDYKLKKIFLEGANEILVLGNTGGTGFAISVLIDNEAYIFDCTGSSVNLRKRDGNGNNSVFSPLDSISVFNDSQTGTWESDDNQLRITNKSLLYNRVNYQYSTYLLKNNDGSYDFLFAGENGIFRVTFDNENSTATVTDIINNTSVTLTKTK